MTTPLDVVAIVGSLRAESFTGRVVLGLADLMRDAMSIELLDIGVLALYNPDIDTVPPAPRFSSLRPKSAAPIRFSMRTDESSTRLRKLSCCGSGGRSKSGSIARSPLHKALAFTPHP